MSFAVQCFKGIQGFPELLFPLKAFQSSLHKELPVLVISPELHLFCGKERRKWKLSRQELQHLQWPRASWSLVCALQEERSCPEVMQDWFHLLDPPQTGPVVLSSPRSPVPFVLSCPVPFVPNCPVPSSFLFHTVMPCSGCPEQRLDKVKRMKLKAFSRCTLGSEKLPRGYTQRGSWVLTPL